jgi:hypothetical protein
MKDFFTNLGSLYWWISVVVVGVLINLFSAYLKNKLDRYLSSTSSWWRKRTEVKSNQRQSTIDKIRSDPDEKDRIIQNELRDRLQSIYFVVFGFGTLFFGIIIRLLAMQDLFGRVLAYFMFLLSAIALIMGTGYYTSANNKQNLLNEAQQDGSSAENIKDD